MPSSRHVRMTRIAISPRLAMRTLRTTCSLEMLWRQVAVSYGDARTRSHLGTGPVAGRVVRRARLHQPLPPRRGPRRARPTAWSWSPTSRPRAGAGSAAPGRRPPGSSLLVSVLLRPGVPASAAHRAVMAAGGGAGRRGRATSPGIDAGLKWPNDLVVGDRKLAGLLAEADGRRGGGRRRAATCNWDAFPAELAATATACNLEAGHAGRPRRAARRVPRPARAPRSTRRRRGASTTTGRGSPRSAARVRVEHVRGDDLVGTAVDVTDDGALVVRDDAGTDHTSSPATSSTSAARFGAPDVVTRRGAAPKRLGVEVAGDEGGERGGEGGGDGAGHRAGAARPSTWAIGCTSRTVDVRNASSASRERVERERRLVDRDAELGGTARARARASRRAGSPTTRAACAPRRRARRTRWSRWPRRARRACWRRSPRPRRARARSASARTFSAYEMVLSPAVAPRSLRAHGTTTTSTESGHGAQLAGRDDHRRAGARRAPSRAARRRR